MAWNGSGVFNRIHNWVTDKTNGTKITASRMDAEFDNYKTGLENCLTLDGQNSMSDGLDLNANALILDADEDTTITADTDDRIDIAVAGSDAVRIGHASGNTGSFLLVDPGALTATAATSFGRLRVANTNAVTIPSGTTPVAAGIFVEEPNLTASGTITAAASLYIEAAPTEGSSNYALWVDAGLSRLEGLVEFDIDATTATANTDTARVLIDNSNALTIPTGTTAVVAGLRVEEPNITATGTVTAAATVYIAAAPTEGSSNYALWVDSGAVQFDGAVTHGAQVSMADNTLSRPKLIDYSETVNALGDLGGGTDDIDLTLGNVVTATVSTSTQTFTFSNPPASGTAGSFTLILTNGGSQTVNWPASVDWAGGTAPTLTSSGVDVLTFVTTDGGTTWYGFAAGLDMS